VPWHSIWTWYTVAASILKQWLQLSSFADALTHDSWLVTRVITRVLTRVESRVTACFWETTRVAIGQVVKRMNANVSSAYCRMDRKCETSPLRCAAKLFVLNPTQQNWSWWIEGLIRHNGEWFDYWHALLISGLRLWLGSCDVTEQWTVVVDFVGLNLTRNVVLCCAEVRPMNEVLFLYVWC